MQLDLGQLQVRNTFSWHGCEDEDPSAIHLDILLAEVSLSLSLSLSLFVCVCVFNTVTVSKLMSNK